MSHAEYQMHVFFLQAAFVPSSESALDTSYFTSRYSWNASDGLVYPDSDIEEYSDADSLSGSSSCLSNRQDEVVWAILDIIRCKMINFELFFQIMWADLVLWTPISREMNVVVLQSLRLVPLSITPLAIFPSR